jgi:hypothetical protein
LQQRIGLGQGPQIDQPQRADGRELQQRTPAQLDQRWFEVFEVHEQGSLMALCRYQTQDA